MLLKLILFLLIGYGIYRLLGGKVEFKKKDKNIDQEDDNTLLECSKCGTYVTKKDAIFYKGKVYCSKECIKD
ncbi:MAG: hypothetical protein GXO02_05500 [Epsilonproteobacteria bacterium]|nr:hypothetical protein [Campylobacterota bacterium]